MTIKVNTGNRTTDLGFNVLGHVVEQLNETPDTDANGTEALALALVAWVAGPGRKISAADLVEAIAAINEQAMIWNDVQDNHSKKKGH